MRLLAPYSEVLYVLFSVLQGGLVTNPLSGLVQVTSASGADAAGNVVLQDLATRKVSMATWTDDRRCRRGSKAV